MKTSSKINSIARNTAWLLVAEFISRIGVFFVVVALANHLGDDAYGELVYGFAIANLLVVIADFGLSTYIVKNLARDLSKTKETITSLLGIKLLLITITIILLMIVGTVLSNIDFYVLLVGGSATIIMNARTFVEAFFRAHQKMHFEAITKIIGGVLLGIVLGALLFAGADLNRIADGYLLAAIITLVISFGVLYLAISPFSIGFKWREYVTTLKEAWPFATTLAVNYLFNYMDSAMLGLFNQKTAVAWYTAAYKPIFFLTAIAGMIITAFFPVISQQYAKGNLQLLKNTVQKLLKINTVIAIPMAVGGTFIAHKLIAILYHPEYAPAALAFQILIWSTAVIYCWAVFGNSLQACDKQKIYMRGFLWGALINTVLNISLIPTFSLYGAAIATLITQLFLLAFMYHHFRKVIEISLASALFKPVFASAIMAVALFFTLQQPLWVMVVIGILAYSSVIILIKGITVSELKQLIPAWKK